MFHEFNIQVANREQYTIVAWFQGKHESYFSSDLVIFSGCEKTISSGFIFQDRGLNSVIELSYGEVGVEQGFLSV